MGETEIRNARVEDTSLTCADGIFTFFLHLDYGGSKQAFGNYAIDHAPLHQEPPYTRRPSIVAGALIMGLLAALKVDSWERIKGQHVRAIVEDGFVRGVGHILYPRWFRIDNCFHHFEQLSESERGLVVGQLWQDNPAPVAPVGGAPNGSN